jgi:hypothetical protein
MTGVPPDGLPPVVPLARLTREKMWLVTEDFDVTVHGRVFTVPKGFITDLDSVPRAPLIFLFWKGHAVADATFHDWLYATGCVPREVADDYFWHLLKVEGAGRVTAYTEWLGVRAGGWLA